MLNRKKTLLFSALLSPIGLLLLTGVSAEKIKYAQEKLFIFDGKVYKPGDTVYGFKNYIKLVVGDDDSPLILAVPHDGTGKGEPEMPETSTTGRDINTLPLATEIAANFKSVTKKRPWIIINTIGRKIVDPNTFPNEVAQRYLNQDAKNTYLSYHSLLKAAIERMSFAQKAGKGALFLDVHGHAHAYLSPQSYTSASGKTLTSKYIDQTEIGYGLSNYAISQSDEYLDNLADSSTIAAIAKANPKERFSNLLRGPNSFGGLLAAESVIAVPSPNISILAPDAELFGNDSRGNAKRRPYFNGGYCVRNYGTSLLGNSIGFQSNISAIQIETPGITVRNNPSIIKISAARFSKTIINYLNYWYGYSYKNK